MSPEPDDITKKRPGHFLVRTTGEVVPLIPVDELLIGFDILGVPRSIDFTATVGMLNLGIERSSGSFYQVLQAEKKEEAEEQKPLPPASRGTKHCVAVSSTNDTTSSSGPENPSKGHTQSVYFSLPYPTPLQVSQTRITTPQTRPDTASPRSQTCRHWCVNGICKWGQQCRYKHIMPMTLQGLRDAGLSDWPTWYRTRNQGFFGLEEHYGGHAVETGRKQMDHNGRRGCCYHSTTGAAPHGIIEKGNRQRGEERRKRQDELGDQILAQLRLQSTGTVNSKAVADLVRKAVVSKKLSRSQNHAMIGKTAEKLAEDLEDDVDVKEDRVVAIGLKNKITVQQDKLVDV